MCLWVCEGFGWMDGSERVMTVGQNGGGGGLRL